MALVTMASALLLLLAMLLPRLAQLQFA